VDNNHLQEHHNEAPAIQVDNESGLGIVGNSTAARTIIQEYEKKNTSTPNDDDFSQTSNENIQRDDFSQTSDETGIYAKTGRTISSTSSVTAFYAASGELTNSKNNAYRNASKYMRDVGFCQFKFIGRESQLDFGSPICCSVLNYFRVATEYSGGENNAELTEQQRDSNDAVRRVRFAFWKNIKKSISKALNTTRANRCNEMKNCFESKYYRIILVVVVVRKKS
jgi:hypothetical protein